MTPPRTTRAFFGLPEESSERVPAPLRQAGPWTVTISPTGSRMSRMTCRPGRWRSTWDGGWQRRGSSCASSRTTRRIVPTRSTSFASTQRRARTHSTTLPMPVSTTSSPGVQPNRIPISASSPSIWTPLLFILKAGPGGWCNTSASPSPTVAEAAVRRSASPSTTACSQLTAVTSISSGSSAASSGW